MSGRKLVPVMVLVCAGPASADITVTQWQLQTRAGESGLPGTAAFETVVALPFNFVRSVTDGGASAVTTYAFTTAAGRTTFDFSFEHARTDLADSLATSGGFIDFTVEPGSDLRYAFEGTYALEGTGWIGLSAQLFDLTDNTMVFRSLQVSQSTVNETLVVGGLAGDLSNTLVGSPTGSLIAGHQYRMGYVYEIHTRPATAGAATADGTFSFNVIPAPDAAALGLTGLAAAAWFRRRGG